MGVSMLTRGSRGKTHLLPVLEQLLMVPLLDGLGQRSIAQRRRGGLPLPRRRRCGRHLQ